MVFIVRFILSSPPQFFVFIFFFLKNIKGYAGWSSLVARRAHNPEVTGSNPVPATMKPPQKCGGFSLHGAGNTTLYIGNNER